MERPSSAFRRPGFRWLAALVLGLAWGTAGASGAPAPKRPNVLLILADDLGYECLSANGSASYRTPNLDRLAAEGARFTHAYAQPLCTPTRMQLMTGRYNFRNYLRFGMLPRGEKTFAHMLKQAGYATAVAGKWQLDDDGQQPDEAGFDEYCLWNFERGDLRAQGDRYADPNLIYRSRKTGEPAFHRYVGAYGPDVTSKYLLDFIEHSVYSGQPFLAYYPLIVTHNPFQPTPQSPEWKMGDRHARGPRYFKDMVEYMDVLVGRTLDKLEQLGVRDNTLVLFMGDNGTHVNITSRMIDGRTIQGGKGELTDAGTHVPLIANWKGTIPAGQVREELVDSTDFLPTLAEATGAKPLTPPGDGKLDGQSFFRLAKGLDAKPREWVLCDYRAGQRAQGGARDGRMARDQRWKLYGAGWDGSPRYQSGKLFDLKADPEETTPVPPGSPEGDAARNRLQAVLDRVKPSPDEAARLLARSAAAFAKGRRKVDRSEER